MALIDVSFCFAFFEKERAAKVIDGGGETSN